ncbi:Chromate transporter [Nitrosospira sp. Nsp18]|nr:Chromate transporter [Nitrosospira sp. Nsp18]
MSLLQNGFLDLNAALPGQKGKSFTGPISFIYQVTVFAINGLINYQQEMIEGKKPGQNLDGFFVFLRLGLTSFGGPIAQLGYFHDEFVMRRGWLSERSYADLVAFCQFLPGPASSQVGMAIGLSQAGMIGALAAWTAFTLPS